MILVDSLQILENEAVQSAIINARGWGILIGMAIMIPLMFGALFTLNYIDNRELKAVIMSKYARLKIEKNYVEMIDACNDCIKGDIRIAKPTAELFGEFPGYDEERKAKELEHFPEISKQYNEIIQDRISVAKTLDHIVEDGMKDITKDLNKIEEKYPKETARYNKEHEEYLTNKTENNA